MKKTALLVVGGIVGVLLLVGVMVVGSYNRMVGLNQATDRQWAQVQNVYQRRADLIPNLVSTVQGAANFEKTTLKEVIEARASATKVTINAAQAPTDPAELQKYFGAQDQLSSSLSRLMVSVERYPELKANANFMNLQAQLEGTENRISVERMKFNETIESYNGATAKFPGVLVAGMFGFKQKAYFKAVEGSATPPKVDFNVGAPAVSTNR